MFGLIPRSIEADGTLTDRVLVDRRAPDLEEGDDWSILCTGAYSLAPAVPDDKRHFTEDDWVGNHKITATTRPEMHGVRTPEG